MRPGLANAFLISFIESIADFGNPIVLGGNFGVLSTEVFFSVVGAQLDQGRAATLGLLLLALALAAAALLAPVALARWWHFGALVPNTFHAKIAFDTAHRLLFGAVYLEIFVSRWPALPRAALAAALGAGAGAGAARPALLFLAAASVVYAAAIVWMGGDHMQASRFCVPLIAPLAAIVALSLTGPRRLIAVALRIGAIAALAVGAWRLGDRAMDIAAWQGTIVGRHIALAWPRGATVALNTAGSTPFLNPDKRFIDMLGLNDATISRRPVAAPRLPRQLMPGHAKGDGAYVLSRRPDFVILGPADGVGGRPPDDKGGFFLSDLELTESPEFARCYRAELATLLVDPDFAALARDTQPLPLQFVYFRRVCGE